VDKLSNLSLITNLYNINEITQYIIVVVQWADGWQATYASTMEYVNEKIKFRALIRLGDMVCYFCCGLE
jgi:hypothetical protein